MDNKYTIFEKELTSLINKHSMENGSDTPDFILSRYLTSCLKSWDQNTTLNKEWRTAKPTLHEKTT